MRGGPDCSKAMLRNPPPKAKFSSSPPTQVVCMSVRDNSLGVSSEIGRLRRVLVHRPGLEIDWMVPSMMERLLFDDILYGDDARWEHDSFTAVLRAAGVECLDPQQLLRDVCQNPAVRTEMLEVMARVGIEHFVLDELEQGGPEAMADRMVTGIRAPVQRPGTRLRHFYRLAPLPNYFFQRDPQIVFGDRVLIASMATEARAREPFLAATIFEHHPALAGYTDLIRFQRPSAEDYRRKPAIEGGDILVPSPEILMIGASERTNAYGVDLLARYLIEHETTFKHLIVVEIPPKRSYMHLDTVFTFIDRNLCLAYLPLIAPGGAEAGDVYRGRPARQRGQLHPLRQPAQGARRPRPAGRAGALRRLLQPDRPAARAVDRRRQRLRHRPRGDHALPAQPAHHRGARPPRLADRHRRRHGLRQGAGARPRADRHHPFRQRAFARPRRPRCMTMPILRDELEG